MIQTRTTDFRESESATSPGADSKDRLKQHTDDVKRQGEELGHKASETARQAGESLKQTGREVADRVSETARQTGDQVRQRASAVVADRKSQLAEEVSVFGKALHKAADTLDENDDATLGRYAHQAGDLVDSCANYLRDANPSEMIRGCSDFTRRHPELVLGGLFLAGVSFARFLKASDRHRISDDTGRAYDDDYYRAYNRDYNRGDDLGYETDDISGYGDIGRYAGEVPTRGSRDISYTRNEDIPSATSPQPGSYPPSTMSGDLAPRLTDETDAIGFSETSSKDSTKDTSSDGPNCPR